MTKTVTKEETIDLISKFGTSYEPKNEKIEALIGEAATSITKNKPMDSILHDFAKSVYTLVTIDKVQVGDKGSEALSEIMKHSDASKRQWAGIGIVGKMF